MLVRLEKAAAMTEVADYLRRCDCRVAIDRRDTVKVTFDRTAAANRALELVRAGRCYACADAIPVPLAELGSPLCQECRDGGHDAMQLERLRLEAFLRTWNSLHPGASAVIAD